jgi:hypothetical protein
MSTLGVVLLIILIVVLLGGTGIVGSAPYGYGFGHRGIGLVGVLFIVVLVLLLTGYI